MTDRFLGEFEQMVLMAVLQLGDQARAIDLRRHLKERTGRRPSRGALYATLDRLEQKGFLRWETEDTSPVRGGIPRRCFRVTGEGLQALRRCWKALSNLAEGLDGILEGR
jgi:DNA-binding PadR family transcriptional regulator